VKLFVRLFERLQANKGRTFLVLTATMQAAAALFVLAPLLLLSDSRYLVAYAVSTALGAILGTLATRAELWRFYEEMKKPPLMMVLNAGAIGTIVVFLVDKIAP